MFKRRITGITLGAIIAMALTIPVMGETLSDNDTEIINEKSDIEDFNDVAETVSNDQLITENTVSAEQIIDNTASETSASISEKEKSPNEHEAYTVSHNGDGVYIFGRTYKDFDINEYRQMRSAQQTNYLTDEQIKTGWVLYDGWAYPPNNDDGSAISEYVRGNEKNKPQEQTGNITLTADVEAGVTLGAFVEVMNVQTYETYKYDLYPAQGYSKSITLPVGTYLISDGGLYNADSPTVCSQSNFKVLKTDTVQVKVAIRSRDYLVTEGREDMENIRKESDESFMSQIEQEQIEQVEDEIAKKQEKQEVLENEIQKVISQNTPTFGAIDFDQKKDKSDGTIYLCIAMVLIGAAIGTVIGISIGQKKRWFDET